MNAEIEKLKKEVAKANDKARILREKLYDAEELEKLPEAKEQYQGKYSA